MKVAALAKMYNFDKDQLIAFAGGAQIPDAEVDTFIRAFQRAQEQAVIAAYQQLSDEEKERLERVRSVLVTTGESLAGYDIVRYGGLVSGDAVVFASQQTPELHYDSREFAPGVVKYVKRLRQDALREIREAAACIDCNAVVALNFDYFCFDNSFSDSTLPYFVLAVNGTAVQVQQREQGER